MNLCTCVGWVLAGRSDGSGAEYVPVRKIECEVMTGLRESWSGLKYQI